MTRADDVLRDATLSGVCASSARDMARMADAATDTEVVRICGDAAGNLWRMAHDARERAERALAEMRTAAWVRGELAR